MSPNEIIMALSANDVNVDDYYMDQWGNVIRVVEIAEKDARPIYKFASALGSSPYDGEWMDISNFVNLRKCEVVKE